MAGRWVVCFCLSPVIWLFGAGTDHVAAMRPRSVEVALWGDSAELWWIEGGLANKRKVEKVRFADKAAVQAGACEVCFQLKTAAHHIDANDIFRLPERA